MLLWCACFFSSFHRLSRTTPAYVSQIWFRLLIRWYVTPYAAYKYKWEYYVRQGPRRDRKMHQPGRAIFASVFFLSAPAGFVDMFLANVFVSGAKSRPNKRHHYRHNIDARTTIAWYVSHMEMRARLQHNCRGTHLRRRFVHTTCGERFPGIPMVDGRRRCW